MKGSSYFVPFACLSLFACSSESPDSISNSEGTGGAGSSSGGTESSSGGTESSSGGADNSSGGVGTDSTSGGTSSGGASTHSGGTFGSGGATPGVGGSPNGDGGESSSGGSSNPGNSACDLPQLDAPLGAASAALTVPNWAGKDAAISYTFDDSHSSQVQNYTALNDLGVRFTFYLTTNWVGDPADWVQALADGHEIGNHTKSHAGTASDAEMDDATAFIEDKIGVTPLTMAAPNGSTTYSSPAMSRFLFNRGVGGGSIGAGDNTNRYNLPTFIPPANADKGALDSGVSGAVSQGKWQVVLVHGFSDGAYQAISLDGFLGHVEGQRDSGKVWIDSLVNVGSYYIAQKLLSDATPSQNGAASTWTWTLPDHFPEGRCIRIQSTGGVSQNGEEVPQDPMGYYDISLDAGEVTVQ